MQSPPVPASRSVMARAMGLALSLLMAGWAQAEDRLALIIGNGSYANVAQLGNPPNDAKLTADTLKGLGFKLVGGKALIDADRSQMEKSIRDFGKALTGGAVGLFYYAGHGVQIDGVNYLVPVNADVKGAADVKYELVDVNFVLDEMKNAGNKLNMVILDACRNNPFGGRGYRAVTRGLAQIQAPEGTLISYATQPGNVASDGTGKDSPFTLALTSAMIRPGLSLFETFNAVGLSVKSATGGQQQPWLASSPIEGSFQFKAGAAAPAVAGVAPPATSNNGGDDRAFWEAVKDSKNSAEYKAYLDKFPQGTYASIAKARMEALAKDNHAGSGPSVPVAAGAKLKAGGPFPAWGTSSLLPGVVGRGSVIVNADGTLDTVTTGANDRAHIVLNLADPNNLSATGMVHLGIMGGVQRHYPDGSTSTQVTFSGHLAGGKISGTYFDKFQTGQFEWTVGPGK